MLSPASVLVLSAMLAAVAAVQPLSQYEALRLPQLNRKLSEDEKEAFRSAKRAYLGKGDGKIPGRAGVDYPTYHEAPESGFSCLNAPFAPGIYADVASSCQAYRVCDNNRHGEHGEAFLCPNGTLFNQKEFSCDWWYNVDCSQAPQLYSLNLDPEHNPYVPKKKPEEELQQQIYQQAYQQPLKQATYQQFPQPQAYQQFSQPQAYQQFPQVQAYQQLPQNYRAQAYQPQNQRVFQQQIYQPQISQFSQIPAYQQQQLAGHGNFNYRG